MPNFSSSYSLDFMKLQRILCEWKGTRKELTKNSDRTEELMDETRKERWIYTMKEFMEEINYKEI